MVLKTPEVSDYLSYISAQIKLCQVIFGTWLDVIAQSFLKNLTQTINSFLDFSQYS
jgi:hypothetical protein